MGAIGWAWLLLILDWGLLVLRFVATWFVEFVFADDERGTRGLRFGDALIHAGAGLILGLPISIVVVYWATGHGLALVAVTILALLCVGEALFLIGAAIGLIHAGRRGGLP